MPNLPEQIESYFRSREDRLDLVCRQNLHPVENRPKTIFNTSSKYGLISMNMQCAGTLCDCDWRWCCTRYGWVCGCHSSSWITSSTVSYHQPESGDGGVGVKNGVNYFGIEKNWVGTFLLCPMRWLMIFFLTKSSMQSKACRISLKQSKLH